MCPPYSRLGQGRPESTWFEVNKELALCGDRGAGEKTPLWPPILVRGLCRQTRSAFDVENKKILRRTQKKITRASMAACSRLTI